MLYITELREICHNQSYMDRNRVSDLQSLMEVTTNITTDLEDELSKEKFQVTDKQLYARPLKEIFFLLCLLLGIAVFLQVVILVLSFCE